jgi:hypothetical protein
MNKIKLRLDVKVLLLFLLAASFCIYSGCRTLQNSNAKVDLNRTWSVYKADTESSLKPGSTRLAMRQTDPVRSAVKVIRSS